VASAGAAAVPDASALARLASEFFAAVPGALSGAVAAPGAIAPVIAPALTPGASVLQHPARPDAAGAAESSFYFLDFIRPSHAAAAAQTLPGSPAVPRLPHASGALDVGSIRRDFPILAERVHGRDLVWLDNAATTQKPDVVITRIADFYRHENSNVHRAAHTLAARSTDAFEAARETVRRFLNAGSTREIVFVRGATEAINLIAQSWGSHHVKAGDEILLSGLEHHSNIVPWQQLAAKSGARLRVMPVDDNGDLRLDELDGLLGPRTRLVAVTQVSNALGTVTPIRDIVEAAHRHGARVLVDGAQAVSHMPVDVRALGADFYVFSGHKIFGPTGIGVLRGSPAALDETPPWQGGGNMINDVTFEHTTYQPPPARFEAGTGNIADAVGLGAALDYVTRIGLPAIARHEHALIEQVDAGLRQIAGVRVLGRPRERAGVVSFVVDGWRSEDVGSALDREGIAVRSGHHCAQPALRRFGVETSVRPSVAFYNTHDEIEKLIEAVRRLSRR
jgi:cysteine desulfurase/selenocysteine lyase